MSQLTASDFQAYDPTQAGSITAGPLALYTVTVGSLLPTQMNEGLTEVDKKADGFDELTPSQVQASLLADIEPVVIGPDGKLYLTDGHHTFTALDDSVYGPNTTVYVNVIANYSNLTETQFFQTMQANNLLLPLNDDVPETVNDATGAPIPTSLTALTSDVYRGLEYSILKNKSSKLFTSSSNITAAKGAATPGLDKMTGFYSDFLEAAAYQNANGGLGLPYLSPADIALATQWNLTGSNLTTLPNIAGSVHVYQLPGFILAKNLVESTFAPGGISNTTLASGALDGNGTFTGITQINAGTAANPILIGTPNAGFIMQLGADNKDTVTLSSGNTYTGGTSFLAGTLIITDDTSLGAAPPVNATIDPHNVKSSVQANNGIIFNSLTEGNATLQIGTTTGGGTATFATSREIAVGGEVANINLDGYIVTLNGQIASLGTNGVGIGNATGFSDLTVEDTSSGAKGVLKLSLTADNSNFYGNWVITSGTLQVSSDASLGNTTGSAIEIGQIELNGGTLQAGANFSSVRSLFMGGGSTYDTNGFTSSFAGNMLDVQRTLAVINSGTAAKGSVSFGTLEVSATAILSVSGGTKGTSVTLTNGVIRDPAGTLILQPASGTLGTTETVFDTSTGAGASNTVTDGIVAPWIVTEAASGGLYSFATYGANGYTATAGNSTNLLTATASSVVQQSTSITGGVGANLQADALSVQAGVSVALNGHSLTLGDGTDPTGLILEGGASITGGTLVTAGSELVLWLGGSATATNTISATLSGSGGLTIAGGLKAAGSGTLILGQAASETGAVTIDSGILTLNAVNALLSSLPGLYLEDTKTSPSPAVINVTANNQFTALQSAGSNSAVNIGAGAVLTIGDTTNNLSSTLSSVITETGAATAGAITKAGSGLLDLSGSGGITLIAGSTVAVQGGAVRIANSVFSTPNTITLASGTELQYAGNGGSVFANATQGGGTFHLLAGTVQLTGTANNYTGGTVIEAGATLDVTTANLPSGGNIINAGGVLDFDQTTTGNFIGVMSDGLEAGGANDPDALAATAYGPSLAGTLIKDDSVGDNGGNVTITQVQTYTGATYIEAGTLTLDAVDTIKDSSGVTLGRVGGGATATLALSANNTLASLSSDASNPSLLNRTTVVLDGHVLTLDPTVAASSVFAGTIVDSTTLGNVVAGSSIVVDGAGTVTFTGTNTFSGGVTIESGTLELGNSQAAGSGAITFQNPPSVDPTLRIDGGNPMPNNNIDGFGTGDDIDLASIANQAGNSANFNYTSNILTITEGTSSYQLNFDPTQNFAGQYFHLAADSGSGTDITENSVACYCPGTLILTEGGEIPVEVLQIGDRVVTASGQARPIKWIGRRSYGGRFLLGRKDILPICIKAAALDEGLPRRDLWISPRHAMFLEGVLIEAQNLANGVSIVQAAHAERVEYFHIELDSHDVLIAEGAPSESFVDDDSRGMFHNAHEHHALYPDATRQPARYCANRCNDGYEVQAIRRRIDARAGWPTGHDHCPALHGHVDVVSRLRIAGWAQSLEHPEAPVCLEILAGGQLIGQVLANRYRQDLARAGLGGGRHGFEFVPPAGLSFAAGSVVVRRALDGIVLGYSAPTARSLSV